MDKDKYKWESRTLNVPTVGDVHELQNLHPMTLETVENTMKEFQLFSSQDRHDE